MNKHVENILAVHKLWIETNGQMGKQAIFDHAELDDINFGRANLNHVKFTNSSMRRTNFFRSRLQNCIFQNVDLTDSLFDDADIVDTNFRFSTLGVTRFLEARLTNCNFLSSKLINTVMYQAKLNDCNFDIDPSWSTHICSDSMDCEMCLDGQTIIKSADFDKSILGRVNFRNSKIWASSFNDVSAWRIYITDADLRNNSFQSIDSDAWGIRWKKIGGYNVTTTNKRETSIGCKKFSNFEWAAFQPKDVWFMEKDADTWWMRYRDEVLEFIKYI